MTSRRSVPYPGPGASCVVPQEIWSRTLQELRAYGAAESEGLVFWGGVISSGSIQVTGLYLIGHPPQGGTVRVSGAEARWLLRELCDRDEKLVCQVHSHPGAAFHSGGDETHATSFHAGFLSIVVPRFAHEVSAVTQCAVFEHDGGAFSELSTADVANRLVVEALVTGRPSSDTKRDADVSQDEDKGWLSTIVSNLKQRLIGRKRR